MSSRTTPLHRIGRILLGIKKKRNNCIQFLDGGSLQGCQKETEFKVTHGRPISHGWTNKSYVFEPEEHPN